jgi:S-formylglutathione hydrolase FrmB
MYCDSSIQESFMILRGHVFSRTLEMETGLSIVGPDDGREGEPRGVVYLLHGLCGRSGDWIDYSMLPAFAKGKGLIFVMPEAARSFYSDMSHGQRYFSYLTEELPEICRGTFNIRASRGDTAIVGASMGGYGALKAALARPDLYGACCAFSSPCLSLRDYLETWRGKRRDVVIAAELGGQLAADFKAIFGEGLECRPEDDVPGLARALAAKAAPGEGKAVPIPRLFIACGSGDPFLAENRGFRRELDSLGLSPRYEEWEGGHDWNFFNEALRRSLDFLEAGGA